MKVKAGVDLKNLHHTTEVMKSAVETAMREVTEPVITSGRDGKHRHNSKHYDGKALDFRTNYLSADAQVIFSTRVKGILGKDFDVILEKDHLHIEFDPKVS